MLRFEVARSDLDGWILFLQTHDIVMRCAEITLREIGLTPAQYTALLALKHQPEPVRPTDVARFAFRSTNSVTYLIDGLEKAGLVQRVPDPSDRRSIHLVMTPKGEIVYAQACRSAWELVEALMGGFSEEDLETFTQLLERLRVQALSQLGLDGKAGSV